MLNVINESRLPYRTLVEVRLVMATAFQDSNGVVRGSESFLKSFRFANASEKPTGEVTRSHAKALSRVRTKIKSVTTD